MCKPVAVVGAGLAGSETAWQLAEHGIRVHLFEMRPERMTPAHKTSACAELVCSNSFKSRSILNAHGLLKAELALQKSLIHKTAERFSVPAGQALAVDRERFSAAVSNAIAAHPHISLVRREIPDVHALTGDYSRTLIATGPLTSESLGSALEKMLGTTRLSFYDAIAPVLTAESIDMNIAFPASRYGKGDADYLNCPLTRDQYHSFVEAVAEAEKVELHDFEDARPFEGCLPIEVMVERDRDTLRFGPLKPVGLSDPRSGKSHYAVVQLRRENASGSLYNMVGFQTKMTWTAQKSVFQLIPGLEKAEFVRLGSIHRNTFINSPSVLTKSLHLKKHPRIFLAGQLVGVEGYMESTAMGMTAAKQIIGELHELRTPGPPTLTMTGALIRYITETDPEHFQPMNANFGLLDPPPMKMPKKRRKEWLAQRALDSMREHLGLSVFSLSLESGSG